MMLLHSNLATNAWFVFKFCSLLITTSLHRKPYFLFPYVLKRWSFRKNWTGIWSFFYYREIWFFFFPKIWSYSRAENERWSFSKKYTEIWYFLQMFREDGPFKRNLTGTWPFLYYLERCFFFPKTYFFLGRKARGDLFQEIHRNMKFSVHRYGCYKRCAVPPVKRNQRWSYPAKIHQKVIGVLDWLTL